MHDLKKWLIEKCGAEGENIISNNMVKVFDDDKIPYIANADLTSALNLVKEINVFSSLAHPGKFNFGNAQLLVDYRKVVDEIFETFAKNGGDAIEENYMSYNPKKSWWPKVKERLDLLNLLYFKTGGLDTHGDDISKK